MQGGVGRVSGGLAGRAGHGESGSPPAESGGGPASRFLG